MAAAIKWHDAKEEEGTREFRENARLLLRAANLYQLHPDVAALMIAHTMHCCGAARWPEALTVAWTCQLLAKANHVWKTTLVKTKRALEIAVDASPSPESKLGLDRACLMSVTLSMGGCMSQEDAVQVERDIRYNKQPDTLVVSPTSVLTTAGGEWGIAWRAFCRRTPVSAWRTVAGWAPRYGLFTQNKMLVLNVSSVPRRTCWRDPKSDIVRHPGTKKGTASPGVKG